MIYGLGKQAVFLPRQTQQIPAVCSHNWSYSLSIPAEVIKAAAFKITPPVLLNRRFILSLGYSEINLKISYSDTYCTVSRTIVVSSEIK